MEAMAGGLLAVFPFLWLAVLAFVVRPGAARAAGGRAAVMPCAIALALVLGGALAMLDSAVGGVCGRYQMDFAFLFALAAAASIIAASHAAVQDGRKHVRRVLRIAVPVTVCLALLFNGDCCCCLPPSLPRPPASISLPSTLCSMLRCARFSPKA